MPEVGIVMKSVNGRVRRWHGWNFIEAEKLGIKQADRRRGHGYVQHPFGKRGQAPARFVIGLCKAVWEELVQSC